MTNKQALEKARALQRTIVTCGSNERAINAIAAALKRVYADGLDSGLHPRHREAERIRAEADKASSLA